MSEIAMLAGLITLGTAATYTAWPFLTGSVAEREYIEAGPEEEMEDRLLYLEERAQAALARLDGDGAAGQSSKEARQSARKRYQKALRLIDRYLDGLDAGRLPSEAVLASLEEEILDDEEGPAEVEMEMEATADSDAEPRHQPRVQAGGAVPPRERSQSTKMTCPSCGHVEQEADPSFCGRCGSALACPSCGQAILDPAAAFCARCGGRLRGGVGAR